MTKQRFGSHSRMISAGIQENLILDNLDSFL
jgi:hypothetical protein